MKRILFIDGRADYGGGSVHMYNLVKGLGDRFERYVACPLGKPFYGLYKIEGVFTYSLPFRHFSIFQLFGLIAFVWVIGGVDVIHSHGKCAGIYSRLAGFITRTPVIHTFHGIHYGQYLWWKKWLYLTIEKVLCKFTSRIINVSDSENREGLKLGLFPCSKAKVIYNGVRT